MVVSPARAQVARPWARRPRPQTPFESYPEDGWMGRQLQDARALNQLLVAGKLYKMGAARAKALMADHPPLANCPAVQLTRPVVVVPGWTTRPEKFDALVGHLTADGANGARPYYLKEGQAYLDKECTQATQAPPDARVFVCVFENRVAPPDETSPQVQDSLSLVRQAVGQAPDVIGYSMGGLSTRVALDEGCPDMHKVVLLGTPNKGTRFAQLSCRIIRRDIGWAMRLAGLTVADLPAMEWMAVGSPKLEELNSRWNEQQSRADILTIGSDGFVTPTAARWWPMGKGDGLVETRNLGLPGGRTQILHGEGYKHHGNQPNDSDVFKAMGEFFGWQPVSQSG